MNIFEVTSSNNNEITEKSSPEQSTPEQSTLDQSSPEENIFIDNIVDKSKEPNGQYLIFPIYIAGIIMYLIIFYYLVYIPLGHVSNGIITIADLTVIGLLLNMYLSWNNKILDFDHELTSYGYIDNTARSISGLSLALVLLVNIYTESKNISTHKRQEYQRRTEVFTRLMVFSFICTIPIFVPIWISNAKGLPIRLLRETRTICFFWTLSLLTIGLLYFINIRAKLQK